MDTLVLKLLGGNAIETSTKWLIIGGVFIGLIGPILHFVFEWTGALATSWFAPVNESPWEHLKLTFWPAMLILIFEHFLVYKKDPPNNFALAKTIGLLVMPIIILAIFYIYSAILGTEVLAIDIASFYIAIIVGQLVTYKLYKASPLGENINRYSVLGLIGFAALVIIFTYFPPHIPLFWDPMHGGYGIITWFL